MADRDNDDIAPVAGKPHWSYQGLEGPLCWGTLAPEFSICASGSEQSPIDIPNSSAPSPLGSVRFDYHDTQLEVVNNGHTLQVNYDPGSGVVVDGSHYELLQFHFHAPSEHYWAGEAFPMELHIVHRAPAGGLAVVGVAMALQPEGRNELFEQLLRLMPASPGLNSSSDSVNVGRMLPASRHYFTYAGSLTTPPCDEGVRWVVMAQPVVVGGSQVDRFQAVFGANARPVQPLNGRPVGAGDAT